MIGLLCREERWWGGVRLEEGRVLELPVMQARLSSGGRWERRLDRAARVLRGRGVHRILPAKGFEGWEVLARRGVTGVDPVPLYRAMAAALALAALERQGADPGRGTVALRGRQVDGDLMRAAQLLCPRVRDLIVDVPLGGQRLAAALYREYGVAVWPAGGQQVDVELVFDGPVGEGAIGLSEAQVQLQGLSVQAPGRSLPGDLEPAPLLTALWQAGRLGLNQLEVTF